ncbi:GATOR complex protein NPRL3 [Nymphon striatum]|nr:GATOR complex protein NPRL3 [Nymphon striatum]
MDESNPLGIFLVKSGSKGDRLLFRYPFDTGEIIKTNKNLKKSEDQPLDNAVNDHTKIYAVDTTTERKNPYAIEVSEDEKHSHLTEPLSNIQNGKVVGFPDKVLSNLFAVKNDLANQKFEMKINDVRFVGHPSSLQANKDNLWHWSSKEQQTLKTTINLFNVVFALRANASHSIVNCYHKFSQRIVAALWHEEMRCNYLSNEAKIMVNAHDEVNAMPEDCEVSPFEIILKKSELAMELETVYKDLIEKGVVNLRIHKWITVSFCLPHKVHRLRNNLITTHLEEIQICLEALRPYHGILLLEESEILLDSLPHDASPSLARLISIYSPVKCLQTLATDCDLTLTHVYELVGHLLVWAKATVIYPLCSSNVYILSPKAPTHITSPLMATFIEKFPGMSLLAIMSEFSLPTSVSHWNNPVESHDYQTHDIQIIVWMLQHRLLIQLHTYIYFIASKSSLTNLELLLKTGKGQLPSDYEAELSTSDDLSENFSRSVKLSESADSFVNLAPESESLSSFKGFMNNSSADISPEDKDTTLNMPDSISQEDVMQLVKLLPYLRGQHHLEEIMYFKNMRRSQLNTIIDKFRHVLITCQHEDVAVATFYSGQKRSCDSDNESLSATPTERSRHDSDAETLNSKVKRKFRTEWLSNYEWLETKEKDGVTFLFCTWCRNAKKNNPYVSNGSTSLQKS